MTNLLLDIRTLILTLSAISLLIAGVMILFSTMNKGLSRGILFIGVALIILAASYALNGLQDIVHFNISIILSLSFYCIGFALVNYGYSAILKISPKILLDILFITPYIFFVAYFTLKANMNWRIYLISIMVVFYSVRIAYHSFKNAPPYGKLIFRIFGSCFLAFAIVFATRIYYTFSSSSTTSILQSGNSQAVYLLFILIFTIVLSIFFILLINIELLYLKDQFLSILSHEVKNKFSAMLGLTGMLMNNKYENTANFQEVFKNINAASREGFDNLNSLLEWSKTRDGMKNFVVEDFNLAFLSQQIIEDYSPLSDMKGINVFLEKEKDVTIKGDKTINELIIRNLLSNAIKFTQSNGSVTIRIDKNSDQAEISIIDSGVGLSQNAIDRILKNKNLHTTKGTANEQGSGFGIYLCKLFIEQQGGELLITSKLNIGSTISYTIPKLHFA